MADQNGYLAVATLEEVKAKRLQRVRVGERTVCLIFHRGGVRALDNRCPHLGFPLDRGTVEDGILTCHWHHARFDLCSGCTFDLFADDVPVYDTYVEAGQVYVSERPAELPTAEYYQKRLKRGLEQNIGLIQAKSIIGLLETESDFRSIVREIAAFGGINHENWSTGMTSLTATANLWPYLSEQTRIYALGNATRRLAENCAGRPARRDRNALQNTTVSVERLAQWLHSWAQVRHRDGAERTLLTAAELVPDSSELNGLVFGTVNDRIFSNQGHTLDAVNKAFELLGHIGWEMAGKIFPTVVPQLTGARGGEEESSWRTPTDLIKIAESAEDRLRAKPPSGSSGNASIRTDLFEILWGEDPGRIADVLIEEIEGGVDALKLAQTVCYAAAMRLARFPESNDINDWFDPVHTFIYANGVYQSLHRSISRDTLRGLFHAALAVYKDRFLNIPEARLPEEAHELEDLPESPEPLLDGILEKLNHRQNIHFVTSLVVRYVRLGHPIPNLVDTLAFATLREDLDFHKLQVLEAGVRQAELWKGQIEEEHIYVAVTRHLAAHCPTRRGESRMTHVAIRLHRGDPIYEDEE